MDLIANWPPAWQEIWKEKGFSELSPIQKETYEKIVAGESILGVSPTGSGKTLAYLWPLMMRAQKAPEQQILILEPSQELAAQVAEVARIWGTPLGLKSALLAGGGNVKRQIERLKKKPQFLIGTPGRIEELLQRKKIKWSQIHAIVLDETDQLLESQEQLIKKILFHGVRDYQLLAFSATGRESLAPLAAEFPAIALIDVTAADQSQGEVIDSFMVVEPRKRTEVLRKLAIHGYDALVFFNRFNELSKEESRLVYQKMPVATLGSDQSKFARKAALDAIKSGKAKLLLATEVAARGLDIEGLRLIVNYELPQDATQYIHRRGRIGRMGNTGQVLTLIEGRELKALKKLAGNHPLREYHFFGEQLEEQKKGSSV